MAYLRSLDDVTISQQHHPTHLFAVDKHNNMIVPKLLFAKMKLKEGLPPFFQIKVN